jgi:hypothetical protein
MNHVHFATYEHRLPLAHVNHLFVDGPIALKSVTCDGGYCVCAWSE